MFNNTNLLHILTSAEWREGGEGREEGRGGRRGGGRGRGGDHKVIKVTLDR